MHLSMLAATLFNKVFYLYGVCPTKEEEYVMRIKTTMLISLLAALGQVVPAMAAEGVAASAPAAAAPVAPQMTGQQLAFDKNKGNCLSCHAIPDPKATSPGNVGPELARIKERYPDRAKLRAQIWDATVANPNTAMPPMGRNKILTEQEIDLVVDYIHNL